MSAIQAFLTRTGVKFGGGSIIYLPGERVRGMQEIGYRPIPEDRLEYISRLMWVDSRLRAKIMDIRQMDDEDGRVKRIHRRTAAAAIKGGLKLTQTRENKRISKLWAAFEQRLHLHRREKLTSDARGFIMEGNLPLQWVLGPDNKQIVAGIRMPSETILPLVNANGVFNDARRAYAQIDLHTGDQTTVFALWQLTLGRLTPRNYDDLGAMGRPYLDASRKTWKKLTMSEDDQVIRRRERAPLRLAHSLEGASPDDVDAYEAKQELNRKQGNPTDFYSNKKLAVTAIQGDEHLDQVKDIVLLLDAFFTGSPAPKGIFGYTDGLSRDILEDLKRDFYDEIDALQDEQAEVYQQGFELELLLNGINPQDHDYSIEFAERRTETPNQAVDRALKLQAAGASKQTVWETAGLDPRREISRREDEMNSDDPYPDNEDLPGNKISITPGNRRKGESGTEISNN